MILEEIVKSTQERVARAKEACPLQKIKSRINLQTREQRLHNRDAYAFERALCTKGMAFICEVKKASPSKGIIADDFPYLDIAKDYEAAGAAAISVLTEPEFFKGDNRYLSEISSEVSVPVLRKDFTIDEYQLYEAKLIGADAVLLICALLDTDTLKKYITICDQLGLSALVEAHTAEEISSAINAGARVIGVNNRNLKTFEVNLATSIGLRGLVPERIVFIAESGIQTPSDIKALSNAGVNGVLIGETLMRSADRKKQLEELIRQVTV